MTTPDVKEIQDRNAAARGRVIDAASAPDLEPAGRIQAAMMELAAVWREEAAHVTAAGRKGHVGIAKEYTQAAARLAGFAVGLTTRRVATAPVDDPIETDAEAEAAGPPEEIRLCEHPTSARSTLKSGVIMCTLCKAAVGQVERLAELVPGSRPGPVVTGDPTMDYLTGATDTYNPTTPEAPIVQPSPFTSPAPVASNPMNVHISEIGSPLVPANPFTSPGAPGSNRAPVKRLTYGDLGPLIAATYPVPRPHLSHSYVEKIGSCGLSALLGDASRAGQIGPSRPSWSLIGGNAFHLAIETIERTSLEQLGGADPRNTDTNWAEFWVNAFHSTITQTREALDGTAYHSQDSWHTANKGLEGYDWWRVEGQAMVERYLAFHNTDWRSKHTLLRLPAEPANPNSAHLPVLEFPFTSTAGTTAITSQGFIDAAWMCVDTDAYPTATLELVDYKSGKSSPSEHFQLVEYADILRKHLPSNFALPIVGRYWMARKGEYTRPIPLPQAEGAAEIDYRYRTADRAMRNAVFVPSPSNFCVSCSSADYCPALSRRDAS